MPTHFRYLIVVIAILLAFFAIGQRFASRNKVVAGDVGETSVRTERQARTAKVAHDSPSSITRIRGKNVSQPRAESSVSRELAVSELEETSVPEGRSTLVVTVLNRRTETPVEGVRVEGSRWERFDTVSREEYPSSLSHFGVVAESGGAGVLRLNNIPAPGRVWLRLGAHGYESVDIGPIDLPIPGQVVQQVYFLSESASVVGRVVRKETREPISGARVSCLPASESNGGRVVTMSTGADGRFLLEAVPAGRRYLYVRAPFRAPEAVVDLSVQPGQRHDLGDIEISSHGAVVRGRVLRARSGAPVTSTVVELIAQPPADRELLRTETDARGEFAFRELSPGAYTLNVPDHAYSRPLLIAPEEDREVIVSIGEVTMTGRLLADGKPVSGSITLTRGPYGMGPTRTAFAMAEGRYELQGIEPGEWTVSLWGPKAAATVETIEVPDVSRFEHDFSLATGKIVGRVVEETGIPVPSAQVECSYQPYYHPYASFLSPRTVKTRSLQDGSFELGPLPEGTFCVRGEHATEGYGLSPPVAVPRSGKSAPVELVLRRVRGATLKSVALSFETGAPIREAFLVVYDIAGRVAGTTTRNDAGVAEIRGLAPGTYRIEVSASGYTADVRTIELREGEEKVVESVLAIAGAVRAWVEDRTGGAVVRAKLRLTPLDRGSLEEPHEGESGMGGLWVERGLSPGAYQLVATFPDGTVRTITLTIRPREVTEVHIRP